MQPEARFYDDIDVVKHFKMYRLRWLGHVARIDSSNPVVAEKNGLYSAGLNSWMGMYWRQAAIALDVWCYKLAEVKTCNRL